MIHQQVDGSELIPGTDQVSGWNRDKSLTFIRAYEPGYETDDDDDGDRSAVGSDKEVERAKSTRLVMNETPRGKLFSLLLALSVLGSEVQSLFII